jgi:hypothetical protein
MVGALVVSARTHWQLELCQSRSCTAQAVSWLCGWVCDRTGVLHIVVCNQLAYTHSKRSHWAHTITPSHDALPVCVCVRRGGGRAAAVWVVQRGAVLLPGRLLGTSRELQERAAVKVGTGGEGRGAR